MFGRLIPRRLLNRPRLVIEDYEGALVVVTERQMACYYLLG
jgi:hypothetical protein